MTFHGVRGSTPCHGHEILRYGGNTSCVSVAVPGGDPIIFDLGTGLRYFGEQHRFDRPFRGTCLLSHLHWDHIQGLPFFTPLLTDGAAVDVYAPCQSAGSVQEVFASTIKPPLFPIDLANLPGSVHFHEVLDADFTLGDGSIEIKSRLIPHVGKTLGYRLTWNGLSVAYLSDHQMPYDGRFEMTEGARELCEGADLLIHDAQYTPEEFAEKHDWGHCTIEFAVWLAATCNVGRLALFHHDPAHDDDQLDELVAGAAADGARHGVEVFAARDGITVAVGI